MPVISVFDRLAKNKIHCKEQKTPKKWWPACLESLKCDLKHYPISSNFQLTVAKDLYSKGTIYFEIGSQKLHQGRQVFKFKSVVHSDPMPPSHKVFVYLHFALVKIMNHWLFLCVFMVQETFFLRDPKCSSISGVQALHRRVQVLIPVAPVCLATLAFSVLVSYA